MLKIELNKNEHDYLCNASFLSKEFQHLVCSSKQQENIYLLEISEEQVDEIRDLCSERLQIAGFDEKYDLSQGGRILEPLIDKFFIG